MPQNKNAAARAIQQDYRMTKFKPPDWLRGERRADAVAEMNNLAAKKVPDLPALPKAPVSAALGPASESEAVLFQLLLIRCS